MDETEDTRVANESKCQQEPCPSPVNGSANEERPIEATLDVVVQPKPTTHETFTLEVTTYCSSAEKIHSPQPQDTTINQTSRIQESTRRKIDITAERIEMPFSSQPLEVVHALLKLHKCAATVFEPLLVVEDDSFGTMRAALWPSFRHIGAWKRDRVLDEVRAEMKGATPQQVFAEASKRLKLVVEEDDVEADRHSSLVVRTLWESIGQIKGFKHKLNIAQQFLTKQASELHFEYFHFDVRRPLRHVKVNADGDCWIAALLMQIKHFAASERWKVGIDDDEEWSPWSPVVNQSEIMKQRKWLAVRLRAQPELITSWTECVSKEAEEVKVPEIWKKQKYYTMLQALKFEDEYSRLCNEHICELTSLGIPLDSATVLYSIYGGNVQAAVDHYDRETRPKPLTREQKKLKKKTSEQAW